MEQPIPEDLDDLTPEWLTAVLQNQSLIGSKARIRAMSVEALGEGAGFAGVLARLTPTYSSGNGPTALVVKLPTSVAENRAGAELMGVYRREIMVYTELLPHLDAPHATLLHAATAPDPRAAGQIDNIRRVERLPIWMLRVLGRVILHSAAAKPKPSVLLIEDLAPAHVGDHVAGCTEAEAESVVRSVAVLHASTWGPLAPAPTDWLLPGDTAPKLFHAAFLDTRRSFRRTAGDRFSAHSLTLLARAKTHGRALIASIHHNTPRCLLHGDLRLDNIFFDDSGQVQALIDWQLTNLGPGVLDLAYFITGSLDPDESEERVDHLIHVYQATLNAHGVTDYPLDRLFADYDDALMILLHRMTGLESIDFGDDRGAQLVDVWLRRLDARLRRVAA